MPRTPIKSEEEDLQQEDQGGPVDASLLPPGWLKPLGWLIHLKVFPCFGHRILLLDYECVWIGQDPG